MRLQSKINFILTPVVAVFMMVIGMISYSQSKSATVEKSLTRTVAFLDHMQKEIINLYEKAINDITLFAGASLLEKYLLIPNMEERYNLYQSPLLRLLASYQQANPAYYEIRVLLPDGYEDARVTLTDLPNLREDESESEYFQAMTASEEDLFTTVYLNPDNETNALLVSKRISLRDPSKEPIAAEQMKRGYLALTVSLDRITLGLEDNYWDFRSSLYLVDARGKVLFQSGENTSPEVMPHDLFIKLQAAENNTEPALIQTPGGASFFYCRGIHNQMYLIAEIPKKDLFEASQRLAFIIFFFSILAIVIISSVLNFLSKHIIVRPILGLRDAAVSFGRGNLEIQIEALPDDEIGDLTKSFKEMSQNLLHSQEEIRRLAYHDFLTGLPNRVMFNEFLNRALARADGHGEIIALLLIDLDNFKRINDTLGHKAGDTLLRQLSERMQNIIRSSDYVAGAMINREPDIIARLGGDEFLVLLTSIKSPNDPAVVARRQIASLASPFMIEGHEVYVTISIGITIFPADGRDVETLVKNADIAMYHAKARGKNNYQYFSESMNVAALERLTLEAELRRALEREEFLLYYQPKIHSISQKIVGVEALVRWIHPERGMVSPGKFIPVAEESGIITPMGEWVMWEAARQMNMWRVKGVTDFHVSVNLSSPQIMNQEIDALIRSVLDTTGLSPGFLQVELTESILLKAEERAVKMLDAIKSTGVRICLDDFGTVYSSLNYLKRFPIDVLKIDKSFVDNITLHKTDAEIVSAIIALAKCLGLEVVAEGVETEPQYSFLRDKGCETIQGYYFFKPMPAEEVEKLLFGSSKASMATAI